MSGKASSPSILGSPVLLIVREEAETFGSVDLNLRLLVDYDSEEVFFLVRDEREYSYPMAPLLRTLRESGLLKKIAEKLKDLVNENDWSNEHLKAFQEVASVLENKKWGEGVQENESLMYLRVKPGEEGSSPSSTIKKWKRLASRGKEQVSPKDIAYELLEKLLLNASTSHKGKNGKDILITSWIFHLEFHLEGDGTENTNEVIVTTVYLVFRIKEESLDRAAHMVEKEGHFRSFKGEEVVEATLSLDIVGFFLKGSIEKMLFSSLVGVQDQGSSRPYFVGSSVKEVSRYLIGIMTESLEEDVGGIKLLSKAQAYDEVSRKYRFADPVLPSGHDLLSNRCSDFYKKSGFGEVYPAYKYIGALKDKDKICIMGKAVSGWTLLAGFGKEEEVSLIEALEVAVHEMLARSLHELEKNYREWESAGIKKEFISTILEAIEKRALSRGVIIVNRFNRFKSSTDYHMMSSEICLSEAKEEVLETKAKGKKVLQANQPIVVLTAGLLAKGLEESTESIIRRKSISVRITWSHEEYLARWGMSWSGTP